MPAKLSCLHPFLSAQYKKVYSTTRRGQNVLIVTSAASSEVDLQQQGMDRLQELKYLPPADLQQMITQKDEDGR